MEVDDKNVICPANRKEWREWLRKNHETQASVWVIYYKKDSPLQSMTWSDAVDEALCFGWIDSIRKTVDSERFIQYFSKRKPNGAWSKVNKIKIEQLIKDDLMAEAGLKSIETAKANKSWNILDEVDALIIPADLELAFGRHPGAKDYYESLSKSIKKQILQWVVLAKRPETRQNRIEEIAELAGQGLKPKHIR